MSEVATGAVSFSRLIKVLLPILAIAFLANYMVSGLEEKAKLEGESTTLSQLLVNTMKAPSETIEFVDADGDLLCDTPDDTTRPEKLTFSYIATNTDPDTAEIWKDLTDKLAEATDLEVDFVSYSTLDEELSAMAKGELHIAGLSTGAVPIATKYVGYWPICTFGRMDGSFGYKMNLIVPSDSTINKPEEIQGKQLVFTSPNSNSGFKAAFIYLMHEHNLLPLRDYEFSWTLDHVVPIKGVASGEYEAASVASDILQRLTSDGTVSKESYRVIYESERFPAASLGLSHALSEDLKEKIKTVLLEFDWSDSSVADKYEASGAEKFVPVNYKDDWANIRRIDTAIEQARNK